MRVTRSIKRIFTDMKAHLGIYQTFNVMSWMIEGTLGTRLRSGMPRIPAAQTGLTLEDDIQFQTWKHKQSRDTWLQTHGWH